MKSPRQAEFGDFQTPPELAAQVCELVRDRHGVAPVAVLEPTCGIGRFVQSSAAAFRASSPRLVGVEIHRGYLDELEQANVGARLIHGDFFALDWHALLAELPDPLLVIGNPPWVTNSELAAIDSHNVPRKHNAHGRRGIEAITGKSNFDISEWMLSRLADLLHGRVATLAVLCKTTVARKVLVHVWKRAYDVADSSLYRIDALKHFDAAVDACLLVLPFAPGSRSTRCAHHASLTDRTPRATFGRHDHQLIADIAAYERWKHLCGDDPVYIWRSGIKHDCSRVMELRREGHAFRNGLGERVELEPDHVYPMVKSSDVANAAAPSRWMLVPQRSVGEPTQPIETHAPLTWRYLLDHADRLDRRRSAIYRNRPRFSIFGVGDYAFAPWKVAISGFYKRLRFTAVGPWEGKPVVLDDTCYFLPCHTEPEARALIQTLHSTPVQELLSAFIFWDAKRPVTAGLLRRLHLSQLIPDHTAHRP